MHASKLVIVDGVTGSRAVGLHSHLANMVAINNHAHMVQLYAYGTTFATETNPNHSSGKIRLTPPAYSHTTILLVSSLNFGLLTRG